MYGGILIYTHSNYHKWLYSDLNVFLYHYSIWFNPVLYNTALVMCYIYHMQCNPPFKGYF